MFRYIQGVIVIVPDHLVLIKIIVQKTNSISHTNTYFYISLSTVCPPHLATYLHQGSPIYFLI